VSSTPHRGFGPFFDEQVQYRKRLLDGIRVRPAL